MVSLPILLSNDWALISIKSISIAAQLASFQRHGADSLGLATCRTRNVHDLVFAADWKEFNVRRSTSSLAACTVNLGAGGSPGACLAKRLYLHLLFTSWLIVVICRRILCSTHLTHGCTTQGKDGAAGIIAFVTVGSGVVH